MDEADDDPVMPRPARDEPAPLTHDGVPIDGYLRGEPIPRLDLIPRENWREVLAPLRHATRRSAMLHASTVDEARAAMILVTELQLADPRVPDLGRIAPPQMPAGASPSRRESGHQLNFRLGAGEYERLLRAARMFAMRPTTLARLLTVRGVDGALYQERRERGDPRWQE